MNKTEKFTCDVFTCKKSLQKLMGNTCYEQVEYRLFFPTKCTYILVLSSMNLLVYIMKMKTQDSVGSKTYIPFKQRMMKRMLDKAKDSGLELINYGKVMKKHLEEAGEREGDYLE